MLTHDNDWEFEITSSDLAVYQRLLPKESRLLNALTLIPWDSFVPELELHYCRDFGQPAKTPLILLKLEFLKYFCRLSDEDVISRSQTDLLFRWFLQVSLHYMMPHPSTLTRFRGRLGAEGFKKIFDLLIRSARDKKLVRDRLRLKDASHVIANIAVPSTLRLFAQLRVKMLQVIKQLDPELAIGYELGAEQVRLDTQKAGNEVKLEARLKIVRGMLEWMQRQQQPLPQTRQGDLFWEKFQSVRRLAEKVLQDALFPEKGDRTLSVVDPDARCGKHGAYFDGYLVDIMIDADSQLITEVDVLPGNGQEAKDTIHLVEMEHETHGNQIEQLSIDGIGFNGEMLRTLEDPEGLAVDVITPPHDFTGNGGYPATEFTLSEDGLSVTCPAGETSSRRSNKKDKPNTTTFTFKRDQCAGCVLLQACNPGMTELSRTGRCVTKNEFEAEYERARQKATTEQYQEVRRQHPAVERKLNEIVRHHDGRRAKYWSLPKVLIQEIMTCFAINVKRIEVLTRQICAETAN